jgi:hypothetical protein
MFLFCCQCHFSVTLLRSLTMAATSVPYGTYATHQEHVFKRFNAGKHIKVADPVLSDRFHSQVTHKVMFIAWSGDGAEAIHGFDSHTLQYEFNKWSTENNLGEYRVALTPTDNDGVVEVAIHKRVDTRDYVYDLDADNDITLQEALTDDTIKKLEPCIKAMCYYVINSPLMERDNADTVIVRIMTTMPVSRSFGRSSKSGRAGRS